MAARKTKPDAPGPADDLKVLFPDADIEVRDPDTGDPVKLTVREFRFREGLEAQAVARPLIADLGRIAGDTAGSEDGKTGMADIEAAVGAHPDVWLKLSALACGRDAEWLARLSDRDAYAVSMAMWEVNTLFFVRRVVAGTAATPAETMFRSLASWMSSSAPATDADTKTSANA